MSAQRVLAELRLAARRGDRSALSLALDQMRTLAHSPRYWQQYLALLRNPLARLVDLLVIKQAERIAQQKGWKLPRPSAGPARRPAKTRKRKKPPRPQPSVAQQPSLFE